MNTRENISELNENLRPFPEAQDVFAKEQPWLKNHFLPLMSIDLAEINPDWAGQKVYMICPFEPYEGYIGDNTTKYHNEYTVPNWLAFRLTDDNKFEFLGKEGYFWRTAIHHWDFNSEMEKEFQKMQQVYERYKANFEKYGALINIFALEYDGKIEKANYLSRLGGEYSFSNWATSISSGEYPKAFAMKLDREEGLPDDGISITYKGNPFYFIADTASYNWCGGHIDAIIMLYEPVSRIVLFTFDYS